MNTWHGLRQTIPGDKADTKDAGDGAKDQSDDPAGGETRAWSVISEL